MSNIHSPIHHPLVDEAVLQRLKTAVSKQGTRIIERIPTPSEIASFFDELQTHSEEPLHERLFYNGEDGTVFVRHTATRSGVASSPYHIHLCTVAHDYTRTSRTPFRQDDNTWPISYDGRSSDATAVAIVPLLDQLQRYLLTRSPAYFHSASMSEQDESGTNVTYTLRTAYRVAVHNEPLTDMKTSSWRPFGWNTQANRPCTKSEATVWAISHIIPTDSRADVLRLRHIHATVRGIFNMDNNLFNSNTRKIQRRSIPSGNSLALLACRLTVRHDNYGRVRYAMITSCIRDQSLLGLMDDQAQYEQTGQWSFTCVQEEPKRLLPAFTDVSRSITYDMKSKKERALEDKKNSKSLKAGRAAFVRILCSIIFMIAFAAIAAYYTFTERFNTNNLIKWILWALVIVTFIEVVFMSISVFLASRASKSKTLKSLIQQAGIYETTKFQVDVASCRASKYVFDGKWLSFNGIQYEGTEEYDGAKFKISDLMKAGYETTFCMDGREALMLPKSSSAVRLQALDSSGAAVFVHSESDSSQVPTGIVDGVRGSWAADVPISRNTVYEHSNEPPTGFV